MKDLDKLKEVLQEMGKSQVPVQTFWATVESVNWIEKTAVVKDKDADLEVYDVLLGLGNDFIKPQLKTSCLCGIIENKEGAAFIIFAEEIEERWINGESNGGLLIESKLVAELNKLSARVDGIISAINGAAVAPNDGGATFKASIMTGLSSLTNKESFTGLTNDKVKHG